MTKSTAIPGRLKTVAPRLVESSLCLLDLPSGHEPVTPAFQPAPCRLESRRYGRFMESQHLAARDFFRPRLAEVAAEFKAQFPEVHLVTLDEASGDWAEAHLRHFAEDGLFDQLSRPRR